MNGATAPRTLAQTVCPVRLEKVFPSVDGVASGSYVIVLRNMTRFSLKGIVFQSESDDTPSSSQPALFVSHHLVSPGADDSVIWNAGRQPGSSATGTAFKVWPSMVIFRDNSSWKHTPHDDCSFRFSNLTKPHQSGKPSEVLTAAQKLALIDAGKASLCIVSTQPSGATVDVDGYRIGVSPIKLILLKGASGPRDLEIYKDGYEVISRQLSPSGATIRVNELLKPFSPQ